MIATPANPLPTLAAIITAARAGSLAHASAMFAAGGYDRRADDPASLAVKGRLLKDQALRAAGSNRRELFAAAATAYGSAYCLDPQPYTRINEASLLLLAGQKDGAVAIASELLAYFASGAHIAETPYYIEATRAEAFLVCGAIDDAKHALAQAIALDPDGWSDHASTLRQFDLLLDTLQADKGWLDVFRPPASLIFAGHLAIAASRSAELRERVDAFLDETPIGFGYGALAAGADIVIAEALLARNAELHVVLPTSIATFIDQSVAPYEPAWRARFDDCLARATSIECITSVSGIYEPLATKLAADVAMGAAVLNARRLESNAGQLLVIDDGAGPFGTGLATRYFGERWDNGCWQHLIPMPRSAPIIASGARIDREGRPDRRLAALLMVQFEGLEHVDDATFAQKRDTQIIPFDAAASALPVQPDVTLPIGNGRLLAFDTPECAWDYARAVSQIRLGQLSLRLAAHYTLVHVSAGPDALTGRGITELGRVAASALPDVITVTETFAAALFINRADHVWAEHIGETGTLKLYALSARA